MRATGIVRRIDDLGRVVIPKEIRKTLRIREGDPLEIFTEKDGSIVNGSNLLPSAYFELNVKSGKAVQIQGKGYGHGVGMSQNGANEMAREGYGWQEILNYFFKDITLEMVGNNLSKRET